MCVCGVCLVYVVCGVCLVCMYGWCGCGYMALVGGGENESMAVNVGEV